MQPQGQVSGITNIVGMTNAKPCQVTTALPHGFVTGNYVRLTDLNNAIPIARGMDEVNNARFIITVTGTTTFTLQDPVTMEDVDSTNYPPYVSNGYCTLIQQLFYYNGGD